MGERERERKGEENRSIQYLPLYRRAHKMELIGIPLQFFLLSSTTAVPIVHTTFLGNNEAPAKEMIRKDAKVKERDN